MNIKIFGYHIYTYNDHIDEYLVIEKLGANEKSKIGFKLLWYDAWVGFYYDRKNKVLYFCPLPFCVFSFEVP